MIDSTGESVATALINNWIARFGVPLRCTTDRGRQFEGHLFELLNERLGTAHFHTNSYHPQANGIIERYHRQLKASIMCRGDSNWAKQLPIVLLAHRNTVKEDMGATPAEMVYGTALALPGELIDGQTANTSNKYNFFVDDFICCMNAVKPVDTAHHSSNRPFVFQEMSTCTHVFVRDDTVRPALSAPYKGPYLVTRRAPNSSNWS